MSTTSVSKLLEQMSNYDKDERYMACSDLHNQVVSSTTQFDASLERRICAAVLLRLDDANNDVQSIAVKTLGAILLKVRDNAVLTIADALTKSMFDDSKAALRDIYTIGLKKLLVTVPAKTGGPVAHSLVQRLLGGVSQGADQSVTLSCLSCLADCLDRFPSHLADSHESIMATALHQLQFGEGGVVKKKVIGMMGVIAGAVSDALLGRLVETLLTLMNGE
ncbi:hypothetical protein TeGR_g14885 [Tetraparma gracilis]|uniref:Uncharacterized protein n=1 Tax=Tetraparma gracilis TaxID=2962635 RepID=A0ABQ6N8J3_9STRA|nr:hypothetical protein TeGR_g14885 [Tetraparma gracilis]